MGARLPLGDPAPLDGALPAGALLDASTPFGVYVHVPFCRVRCGYCDFNTYTADEVRGVSRTSYADTVLAEIALSARVLRDAPRQVETVFFGGGTPTLLPASDLMRMLDGIRSTFGIAAGAEITVEANPDTVTDALVDALAAGGVTRLSIGMQSGVPHVLATLDRTHDPRNVAVAVQRARRAGLGVSLDVIYGAPGESVADWSQTLDTVIDIGPDHVSAYALIVEDGTALARRIRRGELDAVDDDRQADMYELADDRLDAAGYSWYEVSNFAREPADRSRHNLAYWRGDDWWGYGPGAHSHVAGVRWWNLAHPAVYAARLAAGHSPAAARERLSAEQRRVEGVLLRSRVREGYPLAELSLPRRERVAHLVSDGLVDAADAANGRVVLTRRGRLLADAVVRELTA